jgi:hypothetical protein
MVLQRIGTLALALVAIYVVWVGPMVAFFRLGAMRALRRRRQSAFPPAAGLAVMVALVVLTLVLGSGLSIMAIYGLATNGIWLWVVLTRGRVPAGGVVDRVMQPGAR